MRLLGYGVSAIIASSEGGGTYGLRARYSRIPLHLCITYSRSFALM